LSIPSKKVIVQGVVPLDTDIWVIRIYSSGHRDFLEYFQYNKKTHWRFASGFLIVP